MRRGNILTLLSKYFSLIRIVGVIAISSVCTAKAYAEDSSCTKFDGLFSKNAHYLTVGAINSEGKGIAFLATSFFTDAQKEKLYALAAITMGGEEHYEAVIQLHPDIAVKAIALGAVREKTFPEEIQRAIASLRPITNDKWKGSDTFAQIVPAPLDQCDPLVGAIPGEQFADGKPRLFLHHFLLGRRGLSTRVGCESWGTHPEQFVFYSAFTPRVFTLKSGRVYVDPRYVGIEKNGQFQYPCEIKDYVQAREKVLKVPPSQPESTQEYLSKRNIVSLNDLQDPQNHAEHVWEWQVLRNLTEGQELYDR